MKKIPTLFHREYENHRVVGISEQVTPGMEWVLAGEGVATIKMDGSCCAILDGRFYKRYDAKKGKKPPEGAIPCCSPDSVTGHWPHWVPVNEQDKGDKWFLEAYKNSNGEELKDGTYEAVGSHFQNNPYGMESDVLERHGNRVVENLPRSYEGIKNYLQFHNVEGIVFWKDGEAQCKIKRTDFGFSWPVPAGICKLRDCLMTEHYDRDQDCYYYSYALTDDEMERLQIALGKNGTVMEQLLTQFLRWVIRYPDSFQQWLQVAIVPMMMDDVQDRNGGDNTKSLSMR